MDLCTDMTASIRYCFAVVSSPFWVSAEPLNLKMAPIVLESCEKTMGSCTSQCTMLFSCETL